MAPLKFRAWQKSKQEMFDGPMGFCDGEGGWIVIFSQARDSTFDLSEAIFPLEDFVVMQSTGLKDKNGVEIFEGDVVQTSEESGRLCRPEEVQFIQGGFYPFCEPCHGGEMSWEVYGPRYVVLGNVHQNPDLLPS